MSQVKSLVDISNVNHKSSSRNDAFSMGPVKKC
jgi:hypothetical protein